MNEKTILEAIGSNADEAIQKGLAELGLSLDEVEIEILDEGATGLFGIGDRQARVQLTVVGSKAQPAESIKSEPRPKREIRELSSEDMENVMSIARATVQELLEHMGIRAEVETRVGEMNDDEDGQPPIIVDISGNDLSILIGRNAETMNALQLITRMIVGKEIGQSTHLIVDVEGFRVRREETLRQLAQKMADQVLSSGRQESLEPMTPAERRIIHIELKDSEGVTTESTGSEPKRKVVIIPV